MVGIRDKSLSEKIQMDAVAMLEKAKTAMREHKAIQDSRPLLKGHCRSDSRCT